MPAKFRIKTGIKVLSFLVVLFFLIGFVEKKHSEKICKSIKIEVNNEHDNYFVDEQDILSLINGQQGNLIGKELIHIDLKNIELRIETNKFVKDAQVFNDLTGNLLVRISQNRPIARVVREPEGGFYISSDASVLPLSNKFSSRVMILTGAYANRLTTSFLQKSEEGKSIMKVLEFIHKDEFWKSQIVQIDFNRYGEMTFYPQIGKQEIEFGKAVDMEAKFRKLKVFYKKILPVKGWNRYSRISLKYKNQIVCE